ncbi:hypothetical protein, partial [Brachybacterium alimentarium]
QIIHPYLPMTHAVDAFRGAIGGGWVNPTEDLLWLSGWLLLGVLLGLAGAVVQRRRAQRAGDDADLQEAGSGDAEAAPDPA